MTVAEAAVGQRFGRLVVVGVAGPRDRRGQRVLCRCDCGAEKGVQFSNLGRTTNSCGCYRRHAAATRFFKHGRTYGPGYTSWWGMRARCTNPHNRDYRNYGGRGIMVCERWMTFANFFSDMGEPPPGRSIDRINNDGNYEPGNCRWATAKEQAMNRRNTKRAP